MAYLTPKESVEVFHLILLDHLGRKLNRQDWALKGGCNLRFFFRSPRYSDDMDLDVQSIPVDALRDRVNGILSGNPFKTVLEVRGIAVGRVTEHKQTGTTQRWKFGLSVPGLEQLVPTKVEFSRRGLEPAPFSRPFPREIVRFYGLSPLMANHYPAAIVWRQKIGAILSRTEHQARDVFDLHVLLESGLRPADAFTAGGKPTRSRPRRTSWPWISGSSRAKWFPTWKPTFSPVTTRRKPGTALRWRLIEAIGERPR